MLRPLKELEKEMSELKISVSKNIIKKFKIYYNELLIWNKKMNLISKKDEHRIIKRHFLDSLDVIPFIPNNACVLDIGSGAGFPGIPIKIVRKDIKMDLIEPRLKRFKFLTHIVNLLSLKVEIYRERAEDFSGEYNVVLSRSVGKLKWLIQVADPLLLPSGKIITYKGSRFWNEFKEIEGWQIICKKERKFSQGIIAVLTRTYK
jgi:16S rRNA (guanine527-N7)-methyltransferase